MDSINNLKNMRTYLVGPMDRVPDGGVEWRESITPRLQSMNIHVIDPCKKPIESAQENSGIRDIIAYYKKTERFDLIKEQYGHIRNADLRCVDISDFIIAYIDLDVHMCGSYEEIVTANRQKKPILVWCKQGKKEAPNWLFFMLPHEHIFNSVDEILDHLSSINNHSNRENLKRWFFFRELS